MDPIHETSDESNDLVLDDVPESRLSGSSVATYSSLTSSETNSPMSYSEYSIDEDEQQSASPPHVGSRRLPRVRSTPTYANMHSIVDEDDYDSSDNTRFDANQLPDVFEDELEQESSPEATLKRRDRHDSGYVPDIGPKNFTKGPTRRQRYNSSSTRRTKVTYVSEFIERRSSLQSVPAGPDRDNHCIRSALKFITDPLNVLVIGPHDSGKTTLINSLLMSVTGDWSDRAPYGCGRRHNLAPVVLYENPEHHRRCRTRSDNHHSGRHPRKHYHFDPTWKRSADDPCGRVVMWDTRGFENIYSGEHQALLLRYILEGRLHPQNLQQALLLSDETCKKRYKNVVKDNQIDLILYVAAADEKPDLKLFRAIQKARGESKDEKIKKTPVLLAVTKMDLLSEAERSDFCKSVSYFHPESYALFDDGEFLYDDTIINDDIVWNDVHCYESKISPLVDETIQNTKDVVKDIKLLKLFKEIINLSLTPTGKKRTYSTSSRLINIAKNTGSKLFKTGRTRTISI